jgi:cohesin loading factor subunit SCC2
MTEKLLKASDCSTVSLIIMTSNQIAKDIVIEDLIEQIAAFVKLQLTETIFPHYDAVYKPVTTNELKPPNSKRKLANQFNSNSNNSIQLKQKNMHHFYNRMREILSLIGDLVCQIDLTDTIVITLTSFSVMCFFVENINDLQLEALKILTNLFSRYLKA